MAPRYWLCRGCGTRNERIKRKCTSDGCGRSRPKPRVPKHAVTLRDDSYLSYVEVAREIHGVTNESCCVCGKPRAQERRHDRDHDHRTGKPRGLACVHCNKQMPRGLTLELARLIVAYLERVEGFYAPRPEGWPERCASCGASWTMIGYDHADGFNCRACGRSDSDE